MNKDSNLTCLIEIFKKHYLSTVKFRDDPDDSKKLLSDLLDYYRIEFSGTSASPKDSFRDQLRVIHQYFHTCFEIDVLEAEQALTEARQAVLNKSSDESYSLFSAPHK